MLLFGANLDNINNHTINCIKSYYPDYNFGDRSIFIEISTWIKNHFPNLRLFEYPSIYSIKITYFYLGFDLINNSTLSILDLKRLISEIDVEQFKLVYKILTGLDNVEPHLFSI